jgi:hypothetical protein
MLVHGRFGSPLFLTGYFRRQYIMNSPLFEPNISFVVSAFWGLVKGRNRLIPVQIVFDNARDRAARGGFREVCRRQFDRTPIRRCQLVSPLFFFADG